MNQNRTYLAIDLKSFYASVECIDRNLDPMTTHLVVADKSRTDKTICLAVSPSLKALGIPGRPRLFEVVQKVREINAWRQCHAPCRTFQGASWDNTKLQKHPELAVDYLIAQPRMSLYMAYSTQIYQIYLRHVAPEDIHVYSIDEVFIDATAYLKTYCLTAREFARRIILDVLSSTGITATAGIGTNLYLCKVAMDIVAKRIPADEDGVRIAELDEMSYRRTLWDHRPLTDFWRVGRGYAKKLEANGLYTMGDVARCSLGETNEFHNEDLLYKLFGVNAELLIDHAWGWEPCTIRDIRSYSPESNSISSGQVLQAPYPADQARIVVQEMTDLLVLDLVDRGLATDQIVLTIGYDIENLTDKQRAARYKGPITTDMYGRKIPKHAHGTQTLSRYTSSTKEILRAVLALYDRIIDSSLLIRRITVAVCRVKSENTIELPSEAEQLDLFIDYTARDQQQAAAAAALEREKRQQKVMLSIKKKYGKNAILKGINFEDGATARERNSQIGGHKA